MIRLLTYNIEFMMGWPQTVDVIRAQEADIICLQEVARDDCANGAYVRRSDVLEAFDRTHEYKRLDRFYHGCSMGNMTLVRGRIGPGRQLCADGGKPYGVATDVELDSSRLTVANIHLAPLLRPNLLAFAVAERKHFGPRRRCRGRRRFQFILAGTGLPAHAPSLDRLPYGAQRAAATDAADVRPAVRDRPCLRSRKGATRRIQGHRRRRFGPPGGGGGTGI